MIFEAGWLRYFLRLSRFPATNHTVCHIESTLFASSQRPSIWICRLECLHYDFLRCQIVQWVWEYYLISCAIADIDIDLNNDVREISEYKDVELHGVIQLRLRVDLQIMPSLRHLRGQELRLRQGSSWLPEWNDSCSSSSNQLGLSPLVRYVGTLQLLLISSALDGRYSADAETLFC